MNDTPVTLPKRRVLAADVSLGSFQEHIEAFATLGAAHCSAYVCCVNVHMAVECDKDASFARVVNEADLATADGMPILRYLQRTYKLAQERVAGNDIMPALMTEAARRGLSIFLYGGTEDIQRRIVERAANEMPDLKFAGMHAPPFGPLEQLDLSIEAQRINTTGAHIVFVSLGCPKQERWMHGMKGRVNAVMLGLGGAFLLYAGIDRRAPKWMRDLSLEWIYRLALEPGRLWRRYLFTNTRFLMLLCGDVLGRMLGRSAPKG